MKLQFILTLVLAPAISQATMNPGVPRGEQSLAIAGRSAELCVIPTHFADAKYSPADLQTEQALCSMTEDVNAAVCPKLESTNPAILFFSVPAPYTVQQAEAANCFMADPVNKTENIFKKRAKYKSSTSCSYTPSLLAYYHISRLLNDAGHVPPAVLRTLDLGRHRELANLGYSLAVKTRPAGDTIITTWKSMLGFLNAPALTKKKDVLFTDALDQTYGALQMNPTGEEFYRLLFNEAHGGTRAEAFRDKNPIFAQLKMLKPASAIAGTQFSAINVQTLLAMKDASDMVVMDTLLSQEDRFGNIHFKKRYAYVDTTDVGPDGVAKIKFEAKLTPEIAAFNPVQVNQMLLKDNDCGISRENRALKAGLLSYVAHMDPATYRGIQKLNLSADSPETINAFRQGMMFTKSDYDIMRANLKMIATTTHTRCQTGKLMLDLDLSMHFSGRGPVTTNCEI